MTTTSPPPLATTLALPLLGFAIGVAVVVFYPIALGDVAYNGARLSAWSAMLLATPAMVSFILRAGRAPLSDHWRMWWSFALAMYVVHVVLGMTLFGDSLATAFTVQSTVVALSNWGLTLAWLASVITAWRGPNRLWLHGLVTAWLAVSIYLATAHVAVGSSSLIGGLIVALLIVAGVARLIARPDPQEVPTP